VLDSFGKNDVICMCVRPTQVGAVPKTGKEGLCILLVILEPHSWHTRIVCTIARSKSYTIFKYVCVCEPRKRSTEVRECVRSGMTIRSRHFVAGMAGSMCHAVNYKLIRSPWPTCSGSIFSVASKKAMSFRFHASLR